MADLDPPHRIDRLGTIYQEARLLKRRTQRRLAEAVASGHVPAVRAAMARYRAAERWERRCRRCYLSGVFAEYACSRRSPGQARRSDTPGSTNPGGTRGPHL